jgi:hypothetical protein
MFGMPLLRRTGGHRRIRSGRRPRARPDTPGAPHPRGRVAQVPKGRCPPPALIPPSNHPSQRGKSVPHSSRLYRDEWAAGPSVTHPWRSFIETRMRDLEPQPPSLESPKNSLQINSLRWRTIKIRGRVRKALTPGASPLPSRKTRNSLVERYLQSNSRRIR